MPESVVPCATLSPPTGALAVLPTPPPTAGANTGTALMTITTHLGVIEVELDRAKTPCTAAFLGHLGSTGLYRDTTCHRLTTEGIYVLQCGDPQGTGQGGPAFAYAEEGLSSPSPDPACQAQASPAEFRLLSPGTGVPPVKPCWGHPKRPLMDYAQGMVAMANGGPGTTGSQFFIVYRDSTFASNFTVLGRVRKGMDIVDGIARDGTEDGSGDGKPRSRLSIEAVTVR